MNTYVTPFVQSLLEQSTFSEAASALWNGLSISAEGIVGSSIALTAAALFQQGIQRGHDGAMLIITPTADAAEQIVEDLPLFLSTNFQPANPSNVLLFPPMEQRDELSESALEIADESFGERIRVLKQLLTYSEQKKRQNRNYILTVSMPALLQPVPPPDVLKQRTKTLAVNDRVDLEALRHFLIEGGYHTTSAVDLPGEFAVRGYILDLFAPDWEQPVRIEFFNDEIESIRRFDLATQRSLEKMNTIDLTRLQPQECVGASLLDYFPSSVPIVLVEPS